MDEPTGRIDTHVTSDGGQVSRGNVARVIRAVVADFPRYVCNVETARPALCWDADAARLRAVYEKLAAAPAVDRGEG